MRSHACFLLSVCAVWAILVSGGMGRAESPGAAEGAPVSATSDTANLAAAPSNAPESAPPQPEPPDQAAAGVGDTSPATAQGPASAAPAGQRVYFVKPRTQPALPPQEPPPLSEATSATAAVPEAGLRLNFRGVPLDTVLDYMSKAAGFVIVRQAEVSGKLDVLSHQPLSKDEAVGLLNKVLNEKGYAAVRNERTLTILSVDEARKRNVPIKVGSNPDNIPDNSEMVTQIMPIAHLTASRLINDLASMKPPGAVITSNDSANCILITDSQTNIRRFAEIIYKLDSSISNISSLRVFTLQYADATEMAKVVTDLFKTDSSSRSSSSGGGDPRDRMAEFMSQMRKDGGGDRGPSRSSSGDSAARQAATRVVATADTRTNSLVVAASNELMPTIEDLIKQIDTQTDSLTELRVFPLQYADATETANMVMQVFMSNTQSTGGRSSYFFGGPGGDHQRGPSSSSRSSNTSPRQQALQQVAAVPDTRTNSVIVAAVSDTMVMVEEMIKQLDSNTARNQKVFVYKIKNADAGDVADTLRATFQDGSPNRANKNTKSASSRTTQYPNSSPSFGNSGSGSGGGGRSGGSSFGQ